MTSPNGAADDEDELSWLRRMVGEAPGDAALRWELGQCLFRAGQYKEALWEVQKVRERPEFRQQAMLLQSQIYRALD